MPIYEYFCKKCQNNFEKLLSFGAKAPACPECGNKKTEKRISAPAIHFKGSGFTKSIAPRHAPKKQDTPEKCKNCPKKKTKESKGKKSP